MGIFDKLKRRQQTEEKAAPAKESKVPAAKKSEPTAATKAKKTTKPKTEAPKAQAIALNSDVLVAPMLTEKSFILQQKNQYCFYVSMDANKQQVKSAIKQLYGTAPVSVNILRLRSQKKYRWGREVGKTSAKKKAVVTMPEGTVLNLTD